MDNSIETTEICWIWYYGEFMVV